LEVLDFSKQTNKRGIEVDLEKIFFITEKKMFLEFILA